MITHSYLNLPDFQGSMPTINQNDIAYDNLYLNSNLSETIVNPEGHDVGIIQYRREHADRAYFEYMESMIPELKSNIVQIGFQYQINYKNNNNGSQLLPHTDGRRGKFCIQWILDTGGDNIKTSWWQENNQPLLRSPNLKKGNYDNLTLVDQIIWKQKRWGILRTDILHSVYPIMTSRNSFTVSFNNENIFHIIVEKYGVKC